MARAKKDGKFMNLYIDRKILEKLDQYCDKLGQTKTMAIERILSQCFDDTIFNELGKEGLND